MHPPKYVPNWSSKWEPANIYAENYRETVNVYDTGVTDNLLARLNPGDEVMNLFFFFLKRKTE